MNRSLLTAALDRYHPRDGDGWFDYWSVRCGQQSQSVLMSFKKAIAQQPSFIAPSMLD